MNGIILNSVLLGTRIQQVSEGVEMGVAITKEKLSTSQFEPVDAIKPNLIIGERVLDYKAYIAKTNVGLLASSVSVSIDPNYSLLNSRLIGTRVGYDSKYTLFATVPLAEQVHKTNTGISTYGIGYTPVVSDTSKKSELRRWPRNWFGDNIKN